MPKKKKLSLSMKKTNQTKSVLEQLTDAKDRNVTRKPGRPKRIEENQKENIDVEDINIKENASDKTKKSRKGKVGAEEKSSNKKKIEVCTESKLDEKKKRSAKNNNKGGKSNKITSQNDEPEYSSFLTGMIETINSKNKLKLAAKMNTQGEVYSLSLSSNCDLLASCSTTGDVSIWDLENYSLLQRGRDKEEQNIYEYFTVAFAPNDQYLFAAGKRKNRREWCAEDDDNAIMTCPIKIFDILKNECVAELEGHTEEVLNVVPFVFGNKNYLLSGSQDGAILKFHMKDDWSNYTRKEKMKDEITCMVFFLRFIPNCNNQYFVAACDQTIKLFNTETCEMVCMFDELYTCYCDFVLPVSSEALPLKNKENGACYLLSRGVEEYNEDGVAIEASKVLLHKLEPPVNAQEDWKLSTVRTFEDENYYANSYMCRLATNGYYIAAPTITGIVYIWNIVTGDKVAVLKDSSSVEKEVREVLFHPTEKKLLVTGDDGIIRVYESC